MQTQNGTPRLLIALGYLGLTLLLLLPLSVLIVRSGLWQQGLLLYALGCLLAAALLLIFALLLVLPRYRAQRRATLLRALAVVPGTVLLLSLVASRGDYPPIHDISTDLADPPRFLNASSLRGSDSNSLDIKPDSLGLQREAYPDLHSLRSTRSASNAYRHALEVATQLGWEISWQDPEAWLIEAVDTTAIMGFKDDIVIRIRSSAEGSVIDLRSVSRVGVGDLGANARRIRAFLAAFGD